MGLSASAFLSLLADLRVELTNRIDIRLLRDIVVNLREFFTVRTQGPGLQLVFGDGNYIAALNALAIVSLLLFGLAYYAPSACLVLAIAAAVCVTSQIGAVGSCVIVHCLFSSSAEGTVREVTARGKEA